MMKLLDFIFAARPLLHLPVWTVYLISLEQSGSPDIPLFTLNNWLVLSGLNLLFAGAFYYNQMQDEESDRLNNKLGFLQKGLISRPAMLRAFGIVSVFGLLLGLTALVSGFMSEGRPADRTISNLPMILAMLGVTALSVAYSHPKIRLKDKPIGGLVTNMLAHGWLVSMAAYSFVGGESNSFVPWILCVYFSLTVGAIYIMTTIPDREGDAATGKRTVSVAFGERNAQLIALGLMSLSIPFGLLSTVDGLYSLSALSAALILMSMITGSRRVVLLSCKLPLLLLTLLAGTAYPVYLLFIIALLAATRIYYQRRFNITYPKLS